ncbi:MAG: Macrolide export ATP-binding/permease protein MacB, partial [Pseudomonadota bacterium]
MISLRVASALAYAETRRARGTLLFCLLSIALGVLAITAIRTLTLSLREDIEAQGQQLLGADLLLESGQSLQQGAAQALVSDLLQRGVRSTPSVRFYSMLAHTTQGTDQVSTRLVRVRAVGDGFPFYGQIESTPAAQWAHLGDQPAVLVDPSVARALSLAPGDRVKIGQLDAVVLGEFIKQPGSPAAEFSMAPYVFLHERFLGATGLLATGSRVQYEQLFALPAAEAEAWKVAHWDEALSARVTVRTSQEAAANVRRFLTRLSRFMTVVGLVTLFLGALGIGSALHAFMRTKQDHAAVLRCLGAGSGDVFLIYGLLALGIAALGSALGALFGSLLPLALVNLAGELGAELMPAQLTLRPSAGALLHGFGAGVIATFAFTLLPLLRTAGVSPLRVLGRMNASPQLSSRSRRTSLMALSVAVGAVFALSAAETESLSVAALFTAAIGTALGVLFALAWGVRLLARRLGPRLPSFHLRQGVANLERPGNQTGAVIVAVGLGFVLLGTLLIVQRSLEQLLAIEARTELPNLFVIDVQPDQRADVERELRTVSSDLLTLSPMISARIAGVNDQSVDQSRIVRDDVQRSWEDRMRTREYFVSYRQEMLPSESLSAGQFWTGRPAQQEASLDAGLGKSLGIALGDTLRLDIGGLPLEARVTSFRDIQWQALRPNAMILLSPGEIEAAPKMFVASLRVPDATARQTLQGRLVASHPNLTVVDATEAAQTVLLILGRISRVLTALGTLAVLVGAIILGGAVAAGRFARQREAMLFKVLGASRADLRRILGAEYALLALMGTLCGWLLAELIGRAAVPRLFDTSAEIPYLALALLGLSALLLNTLVGVFVG